MTGHEGKQDSKHNHFKKYVMLNEAQTLLLACSKTGFAVFMFRLQTSCTKQYDDKTKTVRAADKNHETRGTKT